MRALLKRALEAKLLDPNVPVKGPRPVDVNPEPLFLHYYRADIRPYPNAQISIRDWETLKLLVENGADLTLDGARQLAEDLQKPIVLESSGRFFHLK